MELLYIHIVTCTCALTYVCTYVMCCSLEVEAWSKKYQEFRQHWAHLSAAIKGSAIEPIEVDCTANPEEVEHSTVRDLEGRQAQHLTPVHVSREYMMGVALTYVCLPCLSLGPTLLWPSLRDCNASLCI